jgi:PII-like signaling protein
MTVYLRESMPWHHRPAYSEIVHRAHAAGLSGAAVFRGIEGYGRSGRVHTTRLLDLAEDLPIAVVVVDEEERVRAFAPAVREVLGAGNGLITLDRVEVLP